MTSEDRAFLIVCTSSIIAVVDTDGWIRVAITALREDKESLKGDSA